MRLLLVPVLSLILTLALAQDYAVDIRHWDVDDGLSHRNVQSIVQDDRGFIWIATQFGLNRFDGKNFLSFSKSAYNFQSDEINHMYKDVDGRLWFIFTTVYLQRVPRSIDIFNPYSETSQSFDQAFGPEPPFLVSDVISFTQKPNGELVFLLYDGRIFLYNGTWRTTRTTIPEINEYVKLTWSPTGVLWIVSNIVKGGKGVAYVKGVKEDGSVVFEKEFSGFNHFGIYHIEGNGTVHITAPKGKAGRFFHIDEQYRWQRGDPFMERIEDMAGEKMFIGEYNVFDFNGETALFIDTDLGYNRIKVVDLSGERPVIRIEDYDIRDATSIFTDDRGRKWISSQFGFYLLDLKENLFVKQLYGEGGERRPFRGLIVDHKERIWAAEENTKLWRYDPGTTEWEGAFLPGYRDPYNATITAFAMCRRRNGNILISRGTALFEVDTLDEVTSLSLPSRDYDYTRDMDYTVIWSMVEDKDGTVWLGTDRGDVAYIEKDTTAWIEGLEQSISHFNVYDFQEGRGQDLWVATDRGVLQIDKAKKKIKNRYWSGGVDSLFLPSDIFYDIHEDKDGTFWLGTGGSGLIHWCPPGVQGAGLAPYRYEVNGRREGLSSNEIYAVYEDGNNNLWLPSNYGLIRFDKNVRKTSVFLVKDGIADNEFNRISHTMSEDSILYFGGLNGFTSFDPNDFSKDSLGLNDPLVITEYQQFIKDEDQLLDFTLDLIRTDSITMAAEDPFFRLEFSLLSYDEPGKIEYAYMIEGLDEDWSYINQNFIRINRMPPGNYLLKVKGQNAKGYWSEDMIVIDLIVQKPYYLRTGFLVFAFLILSGLIFGFIEYRTRYLTAQRRELERVVDERTERIRKDKLTIEKQASDLRELDRVKSTFFANVSHELRTPLTLILGPLNAVIKKGGIGEKDERLLETARKNATELLKLVSSILDLSKIENKKLEFKETPTDLKRLFDDLEEEFSILADTSDKKFIYDFDVQEDLVVLLDEEKIRTCIKNLLSNAFKYTGIDGVVEMRVRTSDQKIRIEVIDDGRGIHPKDMPHIFDRYYQSKQPNAPAEGGTGIGLALTKELIQMMGGKIYVESELDMGSRFVVYLQRKDAVGLIDKVEEAEHKMVTLPIAEAQVKRGSILVVEDHEELQEYLQYILSDHYEVKVASHGKQGLSLLRKRAFDLVITDLMMPVMDGYAFIEEVKGDPNLNQLPIIVLSAKTEVMDKIKALRFGVDDYLTKPFDQEELRVRIKNLLQRLEVRRKAVEEWKEDKTGDTKEAEKVTSEEERAWLEEVEKFVLKYMDDGQFGNDFIAAHFDLSRRQLQRKLKKLVGLTPKEYINEVRMNKALTMLENNEVQSVKEVAEAVGFSTTSYFSKLFIARFGRQPSDVLQSMTT